MSMVLFSEKSEVFEFAVQQPLEPIIEEVHSVRFGDRRRMLLSRGGVTGFANARVLEDPGLVAEFAGLDATEEDVLRFAEKHGALTFAPAYSVKYSDLARDNEGQEVFAESLGIWYTQSARVRDALQFLKWSHQDVETDELRDRISVANGQVSYGVGRHNTKYQLQKHLRTIECDRLLAARLAALDLANRTLSGDVGHSGIGETTISPDGRVFPGGPLCHPVYVVDTRWQRKTTALKLKPTNLLGAIWLQVATAIAGDSKLCEWCGVPFVQRRGGAGKTSQRACCKEHTNKLNYRERKAKLERASKMLSEGLPVNQVARETGVSIKKLKRMEASIDG